MRKFYFLVMGLLVFSGVTAQTIYFPDANLKLKLRNSLNWPQSNKPVAYDINGLAMEIDINHDSEIQVSEALNVYKLDLGEPSNRSYQIDDMTGIENFTNLTHLICYNNYIQSLDVRVLTNLQELNISENYTKVLNVTGLSNLKKLNCNHFADDFLDLTGLVSLEDLNCGDNDIITTLNLSPCQNLKNLICNSTDAITKLVINGLNHLENIYITSSNLRNLTVTNLPNLKILRCSESSYNYQNISNLELSGLNNLEELYCSFNKLISLNLLGMNKLKIIECQNNQISGNLYLSDKRDLVKLRCNNNLLTGLYVKNGYNWGDSDIYFYSNLSLRYICTEDSLINIFRNKVYYGGMSNSIVEVNSYCSFVPEGLYYAVQGNIKYDFDNNGCDNFDLQIANMNLTISDGLSNGTMITNESGSYSISVKEGLYTITPVLENPNYFTISPASAVLTFPTQTSPFTQDFCVTANGIHTDLEVAVLPITRLRPGFDASYKIIYKNKGTNAQSGSVNLTFNDAVLDLVSAIPVVTTQSTNNLTWNFTNLKPFETRELTVMVNVNGPMETPAVNGGDVLNYTASITSTATDETPTDNTLTLNQKVVNSLDPNDKTCLEGSTIPPSAVGKYVHYLIRFENKGTAEAENVVIKDMIDISKFDINSLVVTQGSHPFVTKISETNKVEFIFEKINLPFDDATNDGYVAFKIKIKPSLVLGDSFSNTASIYFDYNFPIITNTTTTSVLQNLGTPDFEFSTYFNVYPNPAKAILNIDVKKEIALSSISIFNILGQQILVIPNAQKTKQVDVSSLKTGNYFIKVTSNKGSASAKFVKE